jgi:hypothetical protein
MAVDIYFDIDNERFQMPILPPSVEVLSPSGNEPSETIALGEITILRDRKLRSLRIDSFFPATERSYPFIRTKDAFILPTQYMAAFERAKSEQIPARLTITGVGLSSFWVSIEDFTTVYGRTRDIDYSLIIKEYRPFGQRAKTLEKNSSLFESIQTETTYAESFGQIREPSDYAVGDRVIVTGRYWSSPDGALPLLVAPANFMLGRYSEVQAAIYAQRQGLLNAPDLNRQRCIIIDREMDRIKRYDLPIAGDTDFAIPTSYRYHVANLETRESIGWVESRQMERLT